MAKSIFEIFTFVVGRFLVVGIISYFISYGIFWYSEEILINNSFNQIENEVLSMESSNILEASYIKLCSNDMLDICFVDFHEYEQKVSYALPSLYLINKVPSFHFYPIKFKRLSLDSIIENTEINVYKAPNFGYFIILLFVGGLFQVPFFLFWAYLGNKKKIAVMNQKLIYEKKVNEVISQVVHDIQSPLAALDMVVEDSSCLADEVKELVINAVDRVHEITNNLISKKSDSSIFPIFVDKVLYSIIKEKEKEYLSYKNLKFSVDIKYLNTVIYWNEGIMKRILSNLINNSVESMGGEGTILCRVIEKRQNLEIILEDSGVGFPEKILTDGITKGESIRKTNGKGLGLHHAKESLARIGGELRISNTSIGAKIILSIPSVFEPSWCSKKLDLTSFNEIVVLDDDISIHEIWKRKIKNSKVVYFNTVNKVEKYILSMHQERVLFLIDYDLGDSLTGADFILMHSLKNAFIITSKCNLSVVHEFCKKGHNKLIPKHWISSLEVVEN